MCMRTLILKCDNCKACYCRSAIPPQEVDRACDRCGRLLKVVRVAKERLDVTEIRPTRLPPGAGR